MTTKYFIPILPDKFDGKVYKKDIEKAMKEVAKEIAKAFAETTSTWRTKVVFKQFTNFNWGKELVAGAETDNNIYRFVSDGVKGHPIVAGYYTGRSTKKALAFGSEWHPKTIKGRLKSTPGGQSGDTVLVRSVPDWPGITARKFDETVLKEKEKWIVDLITEKIEEGVRKQKHNFP